MTIAYQLFVLLVYSSPCWRHVFLRNISHLLLNWDAS